MNDQMINKTTGAKTFLSKNSTTILTGVSVAGVCSTVIFAVKATPKALQLIEEAKKNNDGQLTKKEVVKATWKCYIPAAVMGSITIGCIVSVNKIGLKRKVALTGLYSIAEKTINEYQDVLVENIGKKKADAIKEEVTTKVIKKSQPKSSEVIIASKGETLFYETVTGRYFKSDIEAVRRIINELNKDLMTDMTITLNELFYNLNLAPTSVGDELGWVIDDGLLEISLTSHLDSNDNPCVAINYDRTPTSINVPF